MSLTCAMVRLRLPASDGELDRRLAGHVATCLLCQAEQARYRSMRRWLGDLRSTVESAPPGLTSSVVASIGRPVVVSPPAPSVPSAMTRTTVAAAAGAAMVAAAVFVGYRRSRAA